MTKETLELVALDIQTERRRRNNQLLQAVQGELDIYNLEDLMRDVAALECAYNLAVELKHKWDETIYKELISKLSYAVVLSGEVDGDATSVLRIIDKIFDDNCLVGEE